MELIYLWIENFRGIEKQGYSFTNKFFVSVVNSANDPELITKTVKINGKEQKFEIPHRSIEISKNENYINPLHTEEDAIVNISALVGENGSGKTNIFNCIGAVQDFRDNKIAFQDFFDKQNKVFLIKNIGMLVHNTADVTGTHSNLNEDLVFYTYLTDSHITYTNNMFRNLIISYVIL